MTRKYLLPPPPPPPILRVAKLTSRRGLFALLAIGLLAAGVAGFFMSGAVAQAQDAEVSVPGAPTNLHPADISRLHIDYLEWTAPEDNGGANITRYELGWRQTHSSHWHIFNTNSGVRGVTVQKGHQNWGLVYRVRAVNSAGHSDWSNVITVGGRPVWKNGADGKPTAYAHASLPQITLDWTDKISPGAGGLPITQWTVRQKLTDGGNFANVGTFDANQTVATLGNLEHNTTYDFDVIAHNEHRPGWTSADVRVTTVSAAGTPGAPTDLRVTDVSQDNRDVLAWAAPTDTGDSAITGYELQRRVTSSENWESPVNTGSTSTNFTSNKAGWGLGYLYRVRAVNSQGPSIWSNEIRVGGKPTWRTGAAGKPTATSYTSSQQVNLSWGGKLASDGGSPITGWAVRMKKASQGGSEFQTIWENRNCPHCLAAAVHESWLDWDTTYDFDVIAFNKDRRSFTSRDVRVSTPVDPETIDRQPTFSGASIGRLGWVRGEDIDTVQLPTATSGNGVLKYRLYSDSGGVDELGLPAGVTFDADALTLTGTPTELMEVTYYTFEVYETQDDGSIGDRTGIGFSIHVLDRAIQNYDTDNDGLIEIATPEQLDAIRWDVEFSAGPGSGAYHEEYAVAFPTVTGGSSCPSGQICTGYELAADIDLAGTKWSRNEGWRPISLNGNFVYIFDGNGKTINGLYVNRPEKSAGLFGSIGNRGVVRNLGLSNVDVQSRGTTGAVAAVNWGRISNVYVTGTVGNDSPTHAPEDAVGGIVGKNQGTIRTSYFAGNVIAGTYGGGIAGFNNESGAIDAVYVLGEVTGWRYIGGLVGWQDTGSITRSYSLADIDHGNPQGQANGHGGLVGRNIAGTIADSYFDAGKPSLPNLGAAGQGPAPEGLGKTTSELVGQYAFRGIYANWNRGLDNVWALGTRHTYPALSVDFNDDGETTAPEFGPGIVQQMAAQDLQPSFGDAQVSDLSYIEAFAIDPVTLPAPTGGNGVLTVAINPQLPDGLNFDAQSRTISGAPVAPNDTEEYTYTVSDEDEDTSELTFTIIVVPDLQPDFDGKEVDDQDWTHRRIPYPGSGLILPAASGGNGPLTYGLTPALPEGTFFNDYPETRSITGAPKVVKPDTLYTYTATDVDGDTVSLTFHISVTPRSKPRFDNRRIANHRFEPGVDGVIQLPEVDDPGDGDVTYSLEPETLPPGLEFDPEGRIIFGTPATNFFPETAYRYTATDYDGDTASLIFTITVSAFEQPVAFSVGSIEDITVIPFEPMTPVTLPMATGGDTRLTGYLLYTVQPELPRGLSFDPVFRVLHGTPEEKLKRKQFTYAAQDDDGGEAALTFNLTVAFEETKIEITGIEGDDNYINAVEDADGIEVTGAATKGAAIALTRGGNTIVETVADANGNWTAVIPSQRFPDGEITFDATASKNDDTATASYTLTVDRHVPQMNILSIPGLGTGGLVNTANPVAVISVDEPGALLEYAGRCGDATPATIALGNTETMLTYGPLAEGEYSGCSITVTDEAGNRDAGSTFTMWAFEVDLTAPTLETVDVISGQLRLRFSEEVQTDDASAFLEALWVRKEDGERLIVDEIGGNGKELLLDLHIPSGTSQLRLEYVGIRGNDPVPGALRDLAGNPLANIDDLTVNIESKSDDNKPGEKKPGEEDTRG